MPDAAAEEFGAYLRRLRQAAKMSLPELARRSGVSASHLSRVETGWRSTPAPRTIQRLAVALGVPVEEMLRKAGHIPAGASVAEGDVLADVLLRSAQGLSRTQILEILEYMELRKRQWAREREEGADGDGHSGSANHPR